MRPRGESISTPSSRYVGQAFKHKPQCTQRSRSTCCGRSNEIVESATVQQAVGVKHLFDLSHHLKVRARRWPKVEAGLLLFRRELDYGGQAALRGCIHPSSRRFASVEKSITDARARARDCGGFERGHYVLQLHQGAGDSDDRAMRKFFQKLLCVVLNMAPEARLVRSFERNRIR